MKTFDEFADDCLSHFCNRQTFYNKKKCATTYKQEKCYDKYRLKSNKDFMEDVLYEEFRKIVWKRDCNCEPIPQSAIWRTHCSIWNILTVEEMKEVDAYIERDQVEFEAIKLDVAHIDPKSSHPEKKYNPFNAIVCSRYFHKLLDGYKHPVTKEIIDNTERKGWMLKALLKKKI